MPTHEGVTEANYSDTRHKAHKEDQAFSEMLNGVLESDPKLVLYLENDPSQVEIARGRYSDKEVRFVWVKNAQEADRAIKRMKFDSAIVDFDLGDGVTNGESWIFRNIDTIANTHTFVLTGLIEQLERPQILQSHQIELVPKGNADKEESIIWERLPFLEGQGKRVSRPQQEFPQLDQLAAQRLGQVVLQLLQKWLSRFEDQEEPLLLFGDRKLSAREMKDEAIQGTAFGEKLLRIFAEDLAELYE